MGRFLNSPEEMYANLRLFGYIFAGIFLTSFVVGVMSKSLTEKFLLFFNGMECEIRGSVSLNQHCAFVSLLS